MESEFIYKPTTAFWKISELISSQEALYSIRGGQGASKTISILMLLIEACMRSKIDVTICSAEKSKLMDTCFRDFVKIVKDWNIRLKAIHEREGVVHFKSGSYVEFIGLDKADVGKGRRRDIIYINEANKVSLSSYADIGQRAKKLICDYNPDALFWLNDLETTTNHINLTYKDNEYLSIEEVNNIERYKTLGYNPDGTVRSEFWANKWQIYGLGITGTVEGRIYYWNKIPLEDYHKITTEPIYGVDWGKVDPFAVTEIKLYDGNLYVHEINYASENEIRAKLNPTQMMQINAKDEDGLVTWLFNKWQIPKNAYIIADSNRPSKILTLRNAGWEMTYAIGAKSKLLDRIGMLSGLNIFYTDTSKNIEFEQMNYRYDSDKWGRTLESPVDCDNHCFIGSTLIDTFTGQRKINEIVVGDFVLTSEGYKSVRKKFNNGIKKVTEYLIQLDTFSISLTCTDDHKIKTEKGWKPIKNLTENDLLYISEKDISAGVVPVCTWSYGNIIMEKYQKVIRSIIKMKTLIITQLKTLNYWKKESICANMEKKDLRTIQSGPKNFTLKELPKHPNGINLQKELNGINRTPLNKDLVRKLMEPKNADNVAKNLLPKNQKAISCVPINVLQKKDEIQELMMKLENAQIAELNLRLTNIQKHKIVAVHVVRSYRTETYDLMVDDCHEYFANGILVHNCIDAIAYGVQHYFNKGILKII